MKHDESTTPPALSDRVPLVGLAGVCFAMPLVISARVLDMSDLPKTLLLVLSFLLLTGAVLARAHRRGGLELPRSPFDLPLLVLLLWSAVSIAFATSRYEALLRLIPLTAAVGFYGLTKTLVTDARGRHLVVATITASGAAVALVGLAQVFFGSELVPQLVVPGATFGNKNFAAEYLVGVLPLSLWGLFRARRSSRAWWWAISSTLLLLYVFHSFTRAAWLGVFLQLALAGTWLLARRRSPQKEPAPDPSARPYAVPAFVGLAFFVLLSNVSAKGFEPRVLHAIASLRQVVSSAQDLDRLSPGDPATSSPRAPRGSTSLTERVAVWWNTSEMIRARPLGVGLGNFPVHYPAFADTRARDDVMSASKRWKRAHNDYVQLAAELGVVGLILLAWLLFAVFRRGASLALPKRAQAAQSAAHDAALAFALVAALAGIAADALFSFPFQLTAPPFLCAILLGLLASLEREARSGDEERVRPSLMLSSHAIEAGLGLTLALLVLAALFAERRWRSETALREVVLAAESGDVGAALPEARAAYEANPFAWRVVFHLGWAQLARGELDAGAAAMRRVLELRPYESPAHFNLGLALARQSRHDEALYHLQEAVRLDPSYCRAHNALGRVLMQQGATTEGEAALRRAESCAAAAGPDSDGGQGRSL